ncbi:MAG: class I SAM-dependent methyltransferase [Thermodesulfobacteriota bacterium]
MLTVELDRLPLAPGSRVLDVGCGGGRHIRATRALDGIAAVALDRGRKEVDETAASLRELDALPPEAGGTAPGAGPWTALQGTIYDLPFATGAFDCVILSEVLEHLAEDERALREVTRVLRPGGVLAVSVPRTLPEAVCWALSRRYRNTPGGHVRIYLRSTLERLLARCGYRVVASHFAHALHSPFWWLKCLVGVDRQDALPVALYHRFLVWDLMARPRATRLLEAILNPLIGKSLVLYAVKG